MTPEEVAGTLVPISWQSVLGVRSARSTIIYLLASNRSYFGFPPDTPGSGSENSPTLPDDPGHRIGVIRLHAPCSNTAQRHGLRTRKYEAQWHGMFVFIIDRSFYLTPVWCLPRLCSNCTIFSLCFNVSVDMKSPIGWLSGTPCSTKYHGQNTLRKRQKLHNYSEKALNIIMCKSVQNDFHVKQKTLVVIGIYNKAVNDSTP